MRPLPSQEIAMRPIHIAAVSGLLLAALLSGAAGSARAAGAEGAKPVQLALFNPAQVFNEKTSIRGLRLNLIYGVNENVSGLDLGLVNQVNGSSGALQWGLVG